MIIRYGSRHRQRGMATLLVSLLILVGATLIVMFSARTTLMEQRISGNEIRTKQALNVAQAGFDEALAYLRAGGRNAGETFNGNNGNLGGSSYRAVFWNSATPPVFGPNNLCPNAPGIPTGRVVPPANFVQGTPPVRVPFIIFSCGWSDDRAARQAVLMTAGLMPPLPGNPPAPLIVGGYVDTSGRARAYNFHSDLTIWSGSSVTPTGKAGTTFVRNKEQHPNPPPITDPLPPLASNCTVGNNYICTTVGDNAGFDVIVDDASLASKTGDQFFESFMGRSKTAFKNDPSTINRTGQSLSGVKAEKIWINGNLSLSGNIQIGTRNEPVILIVDGNLNVTGNVVFYGVLYVTGNFSSSGTPIFYGATVVEGDNTASAGTPSYVYDPLAFANLEPLGPVMVYAGTWRDWLAP
jgi:hypothetical protein